VNERFHPHSEFSRPDSTALNDALQPRAAAGHMPFAGHRTQKQVREDVPHPFTLDVGRECESES
jgi:hypothetical protein